VTTLHVLAAADGAALLACGALAARLIIRQQDHARLYGKGDGRLRLRWPRRRVPGKPRDGAPLTGEEEGAVAAIERRLFPPDG
jgi:hypothetical protein